MTGPCGRGGASRSRRCESVVSLPVLFSRLHAALARCLCAPACTHRLLGQLHSRHASLHETIRHSLVGGCPSRVATAPPTRVGRPATRGPSQLNARIDPQGGTRLRGSAALCSAALESRCPQGHGGRVEAGHHGGVSLLMCDAQSAGGAAAKSGRAVGTARVPRGSAVLAQASDSAVVREFPLDSRVPRSSLLLHSIGWRRVARSAWLSRAQLHRGENGSPMHCITPHAPSPL